VLFSKDSMQLPPSLSKNRAFPSSGPITKFIQDHDARNFRFVTDIQLITIIILSFFSSQIRCSVGWRKSNLFSVTSWPNFPNDIANSYRFSHTFWSSQPQRRTVPSTLLMRKHSTECQITKRKIRLNHIQWKSNSWLTRKQNLPSFLKWTYDKQISFWATKCSLLNSLECSSKVRLFGGIQISDPCWVINRSRSILCSFRFQFKKSEKIWRTCHVRIWKLAVSVSDEIPAVFTIQEPEAHNQSMNKWGEWRHNHDLQIGALEMPNFLAFIETWTWWLDPAIGSTCCDRIAVSGLMEWNEEAKWRRNDVDWPKCNPFSSTRRPMPKFRILASCIEALENGKLKIPAISITFWDKKAKSRCRLLSILNQFLATETLRTFRMRES
jgi:hypothetical protein